MRIIYVYHNCFIVDLGEITLVFDVPEVEFLGEKGFQIVLENITGKKTIVFESHGHWDHYSGEIFKLVDEASDIKYFLSHDIVEKNPQIMSEDTARKIVVVKPHERHTLENCTVTTFRSTDIGVAYLVEVEGVKIYHSGDLACWTWNHLPDYIRNAIRETFLSEISKVAEHYPDVAFIDVDPRIENWAGATDFIKIVAPKYIVPMHLWGKTHLIEVFEKEVEEFLRDARILKYSNRGDVIFSNNL